jgi:hypothetical protein
MELTVAVMLTWGVVLAATTLVLLWVLATGVLQVRVWCMGTGGRVIVA